VNPKIGTTTCPLCGWTCVVRESKKGLAYYSCENCGHQTYTRGPDADARLRKQMKPAGGQTRTSRRESADADPPDKGGARKGREEDWNLDD